MQKLFLPILLFLGMSAIAQVKVGNNSTTIGTSSVLELENSNKALLLTRVTNVTDISTPVNGMVVYDITKACIRGYQNNTWSPCFGATAATVTPLGPSGVISGNSYCINQYISKTSCSSLSGATLNDDPSTANVAEYNWSSATSTVLGVGFGASSTSRALVEIGGQCWARVNNSITPLQSKSGDGSGGYYTGGPYTNPDEGLLYGWTAAMNTSTTAPDRGQGTCPISWHVPSDCEWMFLENTLGMSTSNQQVQAGDPNNVSNQRDAASTNSTSISVGRQLTVTSFSSSGGVSSTNSSGFSALDVGDFSYNTYADRGAGYTYYWTSTISTTPVTSSHPAAGLPYVRGITRDGFSSNGVLVYRGSNNNTTYGFSVRCLKD